jgi:hypothetical protein
MPKPEELLAAVERLCHSRAFDNQENARRVLRLIARAALDGLPLTQQSIATGALGRRENFDPRQDAIVRVTAATLRQLIDTYYELEGKDDALIINIPKGTYTLRAEPRPTPKDAGQSLTTNQQTFPSDFELTKPLWPHLYWVFMELCSLTPFEVCIDRKNRLQLPQRFWDFLSALNNPKVFVGNFHHCCFCQIVDIYPICSWLFASLNLSQKGVKVETRATRPPEEEEDGMYYGSYKSIDGKGGVWLNAEMVEMQNGDHLTDQKLVRLWCDIEGCFCFADLKLYRIIEETLAQKRELIRAFIGQYKP